MASALGNASLTALQERLAVAQHQAAEVLANAHLPHLPTRAELGARARAMFTRTPSFDDIVDRAYGLVLDAVSARLRAVPVQA
jgi:stearoyl-CoA desaturase (delta-9 desaturase)